MTDFVGWTPPPGVAVVAPPVHPETIVSVIYSDKSYSCLDRPARQFNWSSYGDGPRVVAYAIVEEYKPAPKVAREWWIVDGCEAWDSLKMAQNSLRQLRFRGDEPIIHVREVLPGREVVAWAVIVRGKVHNIWEEEGATKDNADFHGGTVVKLTGVMPS